ncbi:MAG TPA: glycerophosphodiester phosphodiesterase family protein, partial [Burkholderiales bacterium]
GVDTLELDCGITKDGVVVVHHDRRLNPDLARGPDGKWVAAPGPTIRSLTFAELQRYDVGRLRPGSEYAQRFPHQKPMDGTRIPRLDEVLKLKAKFNIETKLSPDHPEETVGPEEFARSLIEEIRKARAKATIQSFDWRTLKVVEREAPEIETVYLTNGVDSDPVKVAAAGGKIWSPNYQDLTQAKLETARARGLKVVVWTVNETTDIVRMLEMRLEGIISDYPDRVMAELKRRRVR